MASFKTVQAQAFALNGAGATIGSTSITLSSFKTIDGTNLAMTDFGSKGYITIDPGNGALEEQISFTGVTQNSNGTATLTGVKSVAFTSPYTETSGIAKTHAGAATVVLSNTSGFYSQFPAKANDETITGQWTFTNTPLTPPSVSDASTTVKGVSKLSVAPATASDPIAAGTNDTRIPVAYAADAGSTDDYVITPSPAITAYSTGQIITFKANTANTGAATLNVNSLGAKTIKKNYNVDLATGDIVANQIIQVIYDGTNFQLVAKPLPTPIVNVYTTSSNTLLGDSTTRFDVINIAGTTFRYTYDGTGTDPVITSSSVPTGAVIQIYGANFAAGNKGMFTVTGSGTNYFEITNASGVAENDKTLGTGYLALGTKWTKPSGLSYVTVEVQAAGGTGGGASVAGSAAGAGGGAGAGGYAKKTIAASALGTTEMVGVGYYNGVTLFGTSISANAGNDGVTEGAGGDGGTSTGGDINLTGGDGAPGYTESATRRAAGGNGGNSMLGRGGKGALLSGSTGTNGSAGKNYGGGGGGGSADNSTSSSGGVGGLPVVIVTEYY
jgi:hypothetical protein